MVPEPAVFALQPDLIFALPGHRSGRKLTAPARDAAGQNPTPRCLADAVDSALSDAPRRALLGSTASAWKAPPPCA